MGWTATVYDGANTEWAAHDMPDEFAPFRINIMKPEKCDSSLLILTNVGFKLFLQSGHAATVWRIARLGAPIRTLGRLFLDWEAVEEFAVANTTKSPRLLVRESTTPRAIPDDIRPWILTDINYDFDTQASLQWAQASIIIGIYSLADEIDPNSGQLKFKGPPRLSLNLLDLGIDNYNELGVDAFKYVQQALSWVYANEREAEIRHILFASEIARSGGGEGNALIRFRSDTSGALEGAKIAYQMSISELGKDTLKTLSDLRKAITEDTAKVADGTRQTITAVASALALGLGLVAARITTSTAPWLIFIVMVVIALYVAAITYSGYDFIRLQRQLRTDWQPRLYRFLPEADYERMVKIPARHAENIFVRSAFIGGCAVLALTLALGYSWLDSIPSKTVVGKGQPEAVANKAKMPDHNISPVAPPTSGRAAVTSTSKLQSDTASKSETSQKLPSNLPEMQKK